MATLIHSHINTAKENNIKRFNSRNEVYEYLDQDVFCDELFLEHVKTVAEKNDVSYALAFHLITNHLTDILYEVNETVTKPRKKVRIRVYRYFCLNIGFMISSTLLNRVKYLKTIFKTETK